jgi:outer membrane receptor protein involved in Fe transport
MKLYVAAGSVFNPPSTMDYFRWMSNYTVSARARTVVSETPSLADRFDLSTPEGVSRWRGVLGELDPEQGYNIEAGWELFYDFADMNLSCFYSRINDYIEMYPASHAPTYNVDRVDLYGVELETSIELIPGVLKFNSNITRQESDKHGDPLMPDSNEVINMPEWEGNAWLTYVSCNGLEIIPSVHYRGQRKTGGAPLKEVSGFGGYTTADLTVNYTFSHMNLMFSCENIFQKDANERVDAPLTDRRFYFRVKGEF